MRVSREKAEQNREHVIETAARLLRSRGYDGIGVADLMKAAGLTHGGFYRNFESKEDLAVQATEKAFTDLRSGIEAIVNDPSKNPFSALVSSYVSVAHRDDQGSACGLTTLGADAARRENPALRKVFSDGIRDYLSLLAGLADDMPASTSRRAPEAVLAEMVGAVILSRLIQSPQQSEHLLAAVNADLLGASKQAEAGDLQ